MWNRCRERGLPSSSAFRWKADLSQAFAVLPPRLQLGLDGGVSMILFTEGQQVEVVERLILLRVQDLPLAPRRRVFPAECPTRSAPRFSQPSEMRWVRTQRLPEPEAGEEQKRCHWEVRTQVVGPERALISWSAEPHSNPGSVALWPFWSELPDG